jgi:hypothetical protein
MPVPQVVQLAPRESECIRQPSLKLPAAQSAMFCPDGTK